MPSYNQWLIIYQELIGQQPFFRTTIEACVYARIYSISLNNTKYFNTFLIWKCNKSRNENCKMATKIKITYHQQRGRFSNLINTFCWFWFAFMRFVSLISMYNNVAFYVHKYNLFSNLLLNIPAIIIRLKQW